MSILHRRRRPFPVRRGLRSRRGIATVEFALIVPVLLVMLLGLIDFGMAMYEKMELTSAVRAGAHVAIADAYENDTTAIQAAVNNSTNISGISVATSCACGDSTSIACDAASTCADDTYYITVTATKDFVPLFLAFPGISNPITLTSTVTMRYK
jgi:Flp pilus assembly protein TadG